MDPWPFSASLQGSSPQAPAKGADSVLQAAQQARGVPQSLLPAGHPHEQCFQQPALGYPPGSEMVLWSFELPLKRRPEHTPHGRRQQGSTIHPVLLPWRCHWPAQARTLPLWKQSLWVTFLPATAVLWLVAACQGRNLALNSRCVSRILLEPALAGTTHCRLCIGITSLLEDCDYLPLNCTSTP